MPQSALQTLLEDLQRSGVSDLAGDAPFSFTQDKAVNPFVGVSLAQTTKPSVAQAEKPLPSVAETIFEPSQAQDVSVRLSSQKETQTEKAPQENVPATRSINDMFWHFGSEKPSLTVLLNTQVEKGLHPLSVQAKALFDKMLKAIKLNEEDVHYMVFKHLEKCTSSEKENLSKLVEKECKSNHFLCIGEEVSEAFLNGKISSLRGKQVQFLQGKAGVLIHPESLTLQPLLKKMAWQDMLNFKQLKEKASL